MLKINNLNINSILKVGQVLKLSSSSDDEMEIVIVPIYEDYTVKKGDSLYSIATKYGVSVNEIKSANNLSSNLLNIGQVLKIKVGEETLGILECFGEGYDDIGKNYVTYTVKKGDNLYSIAKKYNTSVDNIIRLNNLTSTSLSIGQVLKIKEVS